MDNQPHIRFAETPPGSPKSCMKGARKLTFEEKAAVSATEDSSPKSPRKSTKVCIRSPGDNTPPSTDTSSSTKASAVPPFQRPPDIQFSQHYDQSTPPPNCTSNGNYDFVEPDEEPTIEPRNDPYLMEVASHFVNEIIEMATQEAMNRRKSETGEMKSNLTAIARDIIATGRRSVWVQRAQGTVSKWFTNLCNKAQNSIRT